MPLGQYREAQVRDLGYLCVASEMEWAVGHLRSNNRKNGIQVSIVPTQKMIADIFLS